MFTGLIIGLLTAYIYLKLIKSKFTIKLPDSINETVKNRLLNLRYGLNEFIWLNLRTLKDKLDFTGIKENEEAVVLFNTLPYKREYLVLLNFIYRNKEFTLKYENDNIIPFVKVEYLEKINIEIENYNGTENYHDAVEIIEGTKFNVQVKIKADILPKMGYKVIKVCYGEKFEENVTGTVKLIDERTFENNFLKVKINYNGTLNILSKVNNVKYENFHYFEESGDDEDEYNFSPPVEDKIITTKELIPTVELMKNTSYQVKFKIKFDIETPLECIDHKRITLLPSKTNL